VGQENPREPIDAAVQKLLPRLANGLGCLHISAQIAAVQTSDVGLSFIDVSPQRCGV
jgi:hypothetical protein